MVVLGLTGSIAMGKTEAAKAFARLGIAVLDSDAEVHRLLARPGPARAAIAERFPGAVRDGAVDRDRLGQLVFGDGEALADLEAILHPRVRELQEAFLNRAVGAGSRLAVLDIPLLFETGGEARCDRVAVVSAPASLQRRRVLARPGMTAGKFERILSRQMPDREKRRRADFVINSGLGIGEMVRQVTRIVAMLQDSEGRAWPPAEPKRENAEPQRESGDA